MNEEMEVAGYSGSFLVPLGTTDVSVLVTPTNEAYVRLEHKTGTAGWVYGQTAFTRAPITLTQLALTGNNSLVRVRLFGGIGSVALQFSAV